MLLPVLHKKYLLAFLFLSVVSQAFSQKKAYFIDGYHGGIWGHYPEWNTRFMADQLVKNPSWKINLEIEPETWAVAKVKDPEAYKDFQALFADQSIASRRIEYVSPAYGQSYLYNIGGESIIRQFSYGIETVKQHFPTAVFTTYSSEEPCFTSALPQILTSFGYKYASLKNPNTCWGGYVRAFGGELVNWVGPDGTKLVTVPRYAIEDLKPKSAWETIAHANSPAYINAAFTYGIQNPVGMTLQDAGWKQGPYLGDGSKAYQPSEYKTWTDYVDNSSIKIPKQDWKFSQEDVLTSLVWGSQVLQRIAQQVRVSENKLVSSEKLAAMASVYKNAVWPKTAFDQGWTRLLLSQHHDCWIVPYNGRPGDTWADKVVGWTGITNKNTDSIALQSTAKLSSGNVSQQKYIRVFNTLGAKRSEVVSLNIPSEWGRNVKITDGKNKEVMSQVIPNGSTGFTLLFNASDVPSIGYTTYKIMQANTSITKGASAAVQANGKYKVETDLYTVVINPEKGGTIESLIAKNLANKEFVDKNNKRKFNELRGNFFKDGGFRSSADQAATVSIIENGPARVRLEVKGNISGHPIAQVLTFIQGQKRIDMHLKIDWQGSPGIGNPYAQTEKYEATSLKKAFYDDRDKLLTLFPLNLSSQKVYKNAPFDVTESKLNNTFFDSWDKIKNNVVLNWVDVTDGTGAYGMAMLTDHTTNYAHGKDFPLGLTISYSGIGLWGRNYSIKYPTEMNYALIPHAGKWDKSGIWTEGTKFNEPMTAMLMDSEHAANDFSKSLISLAGTGLEVSSVTISGKDLLVRLFNAEGDIQPKRVMLDALAEKAEVVELNGTAVKTLAMSKGATAATTVSISMPRFGLRTIRFSNIRAAK